jgi:hypothetical protein
MAIKIYPSKDPNAILLFSYQFILFGSKTLNILLINKLPVSFYIIRCILLYQSKRPLIMLAEDCKAFSAVKEAVKSEDIRMGWNLPIK